MDKQMKRQILFNKKTGGASDQKKAPRKEPPPKDVALKNPRPEEAPVRANRSKNISVWLTTHPLFKWSGMAQQIGLDRGNFSRTIYSDNPAISEEHQAKIIAIIKDYGYAE